MKAFEKGSHRISGTFLDDERTQGGAQVGVRRSVLFWGGVPSVLQVMGDGGPSWMMSGEAGM